MVRTLFLAAFLSTSVGSAEGSGQAKKAPAVDAKFVEWVQRVARAEHLRVASLAAGQLDGDVGLEYAAALCDPTGSTRGYWLVEKDAARRWALPFESSQNVECRDEPPPTEALTGSITVTDRVAGALVREKIALREGVPALVASETISADKHHSLLFRDDWEELLFQRSNDEAGSDGIVLAVAKPASKSTSGFTVFGKDRWTGAADASIQVTAHMLADGSTQVTLQSVDDVRVPMESEGRERALLAADHWELWWTEDEPGCIPKATRICGVRQLGIGLKENGQLEVRWLYPFNYRDVVPTASGSAESVTVILPRSVLPTSAIGGARGRFTAAYSDSDTPGGDQETLVATSKLKWGKAETFGTLIGWRGGRRYPPPSQGRLFSDCWRLGEGDRFR